MIAVTHLAHRLPGCRQALLPGEDRADQVAVSNEGTKPFHDQHIYDVMGCEWNEPGNYESGFDTCDADSGEPM